MNAEAAKPIVIPTNTSRRWLNPSVNLERLRSIGRAIRTNKQRRRVIGTLKKFGN